MLNMKESEMGAGEFKKGDVIIRINGHMPAEVMGVDETRYYVRWMVGGDSVLWIIEVDRDYVKVG